MKNNYPILVDSLTDQDFETINSLVRDKKINRVDHPSFPLSIFDYSHNTVFDNSWDLYTFNSRGLVIDTNTRKIVARPFVKIWNDTEVPELFKSKSKLPIVKIEDKVDGSLGILFKYKGDIFINTRGSFTSDQAIKAKEIWNSKYSHLNSKIKEGETHLFEIIYKDNKIVLDYEFEDLVYLTSYNNNNGEEFEFEHWCYRKVEKYNSELKDIEKIRNSNGGELREGWVVTFDDGSKFKIKTLEYMILHKSISNLSTTAIWEAVQLDPNVKSLIESVPDEYYDTIREHVKNLITSYNQKIQDAMKLLDSIDPFSSDKQIFLEYGDHPDFWLMTQIRKNKQFQKKLWQQLKPKHIYLNNLNNHGSN